MTTDRLAEIERLNEYLFKLVNAVAGKTWDVPDPAVHAYLKHLNTHFPGHQVRQLLAEVHRLREENSELVSLVENLEREVDELDRYAPNNFSVGEDFDE